MTRWTTLTDAEFDCRVHKLNWPKSRFVAGTRLVLVEGLTVRAASARVGAGRGAVARRCRCIAATRLADSAAVYCVHSAELQRCLGYRKTLAGARRVRRVALVVRELVRRPEHAGRLLYAYTDDVAVFAAQPDGSFRRVEP